MGPRYGVDVLKAGKMGNAQMKAIDVCFVFWGGHTKVVFDQQKSEDGNRAVLRSGP